MVDQVYANAVRRVLVTSIDALNANKQYYVLNPDEEMEYLKEKNPQLYEKLRQIEKEQKAYEDGRVHFPPWRGSNRMSG